MTDSSYGELTGSNRKGPRLTPDQLADLERALGVSLPLDYARFLAWGDGWEGWLGESFLRLHGHHELPFANDQSFRDSFPSLIAIGGDGGLETYAFDYREGQLTPGVVALDRNSADEDDIWPVAEGFTEAMTFLASAP